MLILLKIGCRSESMAEKFVGWGSLSFYPFQIEKLFYTRALGDGPRNFEPWSNDEDDTCAGTPSPSYHTTATGRRLSSDRFNVHRSPIRWVFSATGLELVTCQPRSHILTTTQPQPH
ncbi:hypothetical protein TNCV_4882281 [Trichonephila clavipes]|nr:hypothetical protein TNCV_4882281 [Trichonephila clavipes]